MIPTKENAHAIATKMSDYLQGEVVTVSKVEAYTTSIDVRRDKNGLDSSGWIGSAAKQELPVKVTDVSLMWSTGACTFSICFGEGDSYIVFPAKNVVVVSQYSAAGNLEVWTFIGGGK